MTPDRWQQMQALFFALVDLPPDAQQARLAALQARDPQLAEELQALLLADGQTLPLLDDTPWFEVEPDDPIPEQLGAYRPIRLLGRGGMGLVYLAERADETFQQQVALKMVRPDLLDRTFIRRFLQERQILAQLNHPGIARLIDGGALPDGRPFLAMEYVDGIPIDRFCDDHCLSIAARIRLFDQVLEAIAYAHRHLVVHRDLKPSNILVTEQEGTPRIKLLDFGIARLLDAEASTHTRTEQYLLTPAYAAPEQLTGRLITTATDVYALGTILYQLLTGHLPFEGPFPKLVAHILEQEPERASHVVTRLAAGDDGTPVPPASLAARRNTSPERLRRQLRGDLEAILGKALRKEPADRYASAEALREDLQRYLQQQPVQARRGTTGYRLRRFVQRHRQGVLLTAGVLMLLVLLVFYHLDRLARERDLARREAARAEATLAFMESLFEGADPDVAGGDTLTAFELLERGARQLQQPGILPPAATAQTAHLLGSLFLKLGAYDQAALWLTRALSHWEQVPDAAPGRAASLLQLGHLATRQGQYAHADSFFTEALALPGTPLDRASRLVDYGEALTERQAYRQADAILHTALALLPASDDSAIQALRADAWFALGTIAMNEADYAQAESLFVRVLSWREAHLGRMHNRTIDVLNNLGNLYADVYRYEEADSLLSKVLALREALLGPDHPLTGEALNNLGLVAYGLGDYDRADSLLRRSLALAERHLGPVHRDVGMTLNNLGWVALQRGDTNTAEARFRKALDIMEQASGPVSADAALLLGNVGFVLHRQGRPADALPFLQRAVDVRRQVHGNSSMHVAWRLFALGEALRDLGRYEEAEAVHRESVALRRALRPPEHFDLARGLDGLARVLADRGKHDEAIQAFEEALPIYRTYYENNLLHPTLWNLLRSLITSLHTRDQHERIDQLLTELRAALPPDDPRYEELARLQILRGTHSSRFTPSTHQQ